MFVPVLQMRKIWPEGDQEAAQGCTRMEELACKPWLALWLLWPALSQEHRCRGSVLVGESSQEHCSLRDEKLLHLRQEVAVLRWLWFQRSRLSGSQSYPNISPLSAAINSTGNSSKIPHVLSKIV